MVVPISQGFIKQDFVNSRYLMLSDEARSIVSSAGAFPEALDGGWI